MRWQERLCFWVAVAAVAVVACGEPPTSDSSITSVLVTSPIDTIVARDRTAQLVATARDGTGRAVADAQLTWQTSNTAVATVSGTGLVTALAAGPVTITASAPGAAGPVSGGLRLRVVAADLVTVTALAGDAFVGTLVTGLSGAQRTAVQTAIGTCETGASAGNVVAVAGCASTVRAQSLAATDATDRALLAVLVLYTDQIERLLGL